MAAWHHADIFRHYCRSYTDFVEWLPNTKLPDYIGLKSIPDEGTLCKEEKRLKPFLEAISILLVLSLLPKSFVAGADMTGLQTKRKSAYYIKRILGVNS